MAAGETASDDGTRREVEGGQRCRGGGATPTATRRHLLAWLFLVEGLSLGVFNFTQQYAPLALGLTSRRLSLPGGEVASWLTSWTNLPGIVIGVVFLVLLFPDGRLPSRRWWPVGLGGAVAAVVPTVVLAAGTWPLRWPGWASASSGSGCGTSTV